jgi:Zn-dependent protease with chaperone function
MNGILSIKDYLSLSLIPGGLLIWYTGIYYGSLMSLCINSILIPIAIVNLNWTTWVRLLISKLNSIEEKEVASKKGFFNWLKYHAYSTHPPIKERIEALRLPSN